MLIHNTIYWLIYKCCIQWCRNEFESKGWRHPSEFLDVFLHFFGPIKVQIVNLLGAFVMVSTV